MNPHRTPSLRPLPRSAWGGLGPQHEPRHPRAAAWGRGVQRQSGDDGAGRVQRVRQRALALQPLSDAQLHSVRTELQVEGARNGLASAHVEACCALVAEVARRVLKRQAHDGQLLAALCMLDGCLVELPAGEGKSLAVALAAATGALCGMPVHVLTANEHLVERDARCFEPLFDALGLSVATVIGALSAEQRSVACAARVVYATAKELALDCLRNAATYDDHTSPLMQRVAALLAPQGEGRQLRGPGLALIDDADSLLIDDAQTPLVLSREVEGSPDRAFTWQAWSLSGRLAAGDDYTLLNAGQRVELTAAGQAQLERFAAALKPEWLNARHREESVLAALTARHVLQRERDYAVCHQDAPAGARPVPDVRIVYAATECVTDSLHWPSGLHAFVCLKEGCRSGPELETVGRISLQSFLLRYHRIGGTSGTLWEARRELARRYGLAVVAVASQLPSRRVELPPRAFVNTPARWQAVLARCQQMIAAGRPVLVGTDSATQSRELSACLHAAGIDHRTLAQARGDAAEARTLASAGAGGCVTVVTQQAGRGTGIELDAAALRAGGLHVIGCQHNPSRRLDRELIDRAGRQGQPGSSEIWLALDAPPFCRAAHGRVAARLLGLLAAGPRVRLHARGLRSIMALLQWLEGRAAARGRAGGAGEAPAAGLRVLRKPTLAVATTASVPV